MLTRALNINPVEDNKALMRLIYLMISGEKRVLEAIDYDSMYIFIEELIATPSYGGHESKAQELMIAKLEKLGLKVDTWNIDFEELSKHPDFSMSYERKEGLGVVGTTGEEDGKSIIICGHIDTVAPGNIKNWITNPFQATKKDDRIYGRGTTDMKAGLVAGLYAIKAVTDTVKLKGKIIFQSVIGEEDGGCGALSTCLRGYKADAGIVMEPSETKIAPKIAGAISFKVIVHGKSIHACVADEGISAIEKFIVIFNGLKELEEERNKRFKDPLYKRYTVPHALSIGTINGGNWPGTVPDNLLFEGRIGVAISETEKKVREEFEIKINKIADNDPWLCTHRPTVIWDGYSFASSMIPLDHQIVKDLGKAYYDVTGKDPIHEGMTYASDVRHLINIAKTPTTVFGPGDVRVAHGANEYVPIKQLETTVKTLALTIMRFVGYEEYT